MILLDGRVLANKILDGLKKKMNGSEKRPTLGVVMVGDNPVSKKFVGEKQKRAEETGINLRVFNLGDGSSEKELKDVLIRLVEDKNIDGIIVQLPLPSKFNQQGLLDLIPKEKDPDFLSSKYFEAFAVGSSEILPPVVGAIKALLNEYEIDYKHAYTVVVGQGKLVGRPVALWLKNESATFAVVDENTPDSADIIRSGDIVISGVGKPGFITSDIIKDGAVLIDAGTSETGGKVVGDVDFDSVAPKTSFITPVPGGVGPVTVAMLFSNLIFLAKNCGQA